MVIAIFISFYFSLKFIIAQNLNKTNLLIQLQNNGDKIIQIQNMKKISSFFTSEDESNEEKSNLIIVILKAIRDNPQGARVMFEFLKPTIKKELESILVKNNMTFFNNLIEEIFNNNTFFDDLFNVIEKHPEIINDTLILVTASEEGKNITQNDLFKFLHNILNVQGMDVVFAHIINSPHNDAFLKLIEINLFKGTNYKFNETFYQYKDPIIQLIYKILKEGLFTSENQLNKNIIVHILELFKEYPQIVRKLLNFIKLYINDNKEVLNTFLNQANMSFLYNLIEDIFRLNSTFVDDLSYVIENHKELINDTLILVKADAEGKNITQYELFKNIHNILNIEGMDKVFNHIINSTHNDAILKLIEINLFNGTDYKFNETFYQYKDPIIQLIYKILKEGLFTSENELNKNIIIYILEFFKEYPQIVRKLLNFIKLYINDNKEVLNSFLKQVNMSFLYNLIEDIFRLDSTFVDDLSNVIENHTEVINYTLILVKADAEGKNITQYELFKYIHKILNIEGMDKVFSHIINSKHNIAILKSIETKFLNGTIYANLYNYFKNDVIYPYKDQIIQLTYKILKAGLFTSENELNQNIIVYILELIRDNPGIARKIFNSLKLYINDNKKIFVEFLYQNNASNLYNLTEEIFSMNNTFFTNLSEVIENHTEIITNIINLVLYFY